MDYVVSYSSSTDTDPLAHNTYSRYDDMQDTPPPFFAPVLQGLLLLSIVLAILLVALFCSHPMTPQTLVSDFWAGVDGIARLW